MLRLVRPPGLWFVVLALWALPGTAQAGGFSLNRYGGLWGNSNATGGLAAYWNPSRLALMGPGAFLTLDVVLISRDASYDRPLSAVSCLMREPDEPGYCDPDSEDPVEQQQYQDIVDSNVGLGTTGSTGPLPYGAAGYVRQFGEDVAVAGALSAFATHGGVSKWDKHPDAPSHVPGAYDGPNRFGTQATNLLLLHYTASLGVAMTGDWLGGGTLTLGGSLAYVDANISTVKARNLDNSDDLLLDSGAIKEGRIHFTGSDWDIVGTLSASFSTDMIDISVNYRPGHEMILEGPLRQAYATEPITNSVAQLRFPVPHTVLGAASLRLGPIGLTGTAEYITWSVVDKHVVKERDSGSVILDQLRGLDNVLGVRGIVHLFLPQDFEFALVVGFEPSAMPLNNLEPGFIDADKWQFGGGARYQLSFMRLGLNYIHDLFETRTVTESTQKPVAYGTYKEHRGHLNLTVDVSF